MTRENLTMLLKEPALAKLELSLKKPNIFSVLRIEHNEIRHSNFLAWLLDPTQGHNLGDTFLKWFLKDVFGDEKIDWIDEFSVDNLKFDDLVIYREYRNIDLLLVTTEFVIVIENKLMATEHDDQLKRYKIITEKYFPTRKHAFVFLTLHGDEAENITDNNTYVNYSYENICTILEMIIEVYKESLPDNAFYYIRDYLGVLKRHVMQEDELISISQELYKNHKEAIDFIIENKPDRLLTIMPTIIEVIKEEGYIPGSQNKGYARFLTKEINDIIPRTSSGDWKNRELFLFEISLWSKNITLKAVIAPGDEKNRDKLLGVLTTIPECRDIKTKLWTTTHSKKKAINVQDDKFEDLELLKSEIRIFIKEQKNFISEVSEKIYLIRNELQ